MNDQAIEQEIIAKGKTAPRVTPADVEANIASEHYFTAHDGVIGAMFDAGLIDDPHGHNVPCEFGLVTLCVLKLRNTTKIVGINYGPVVAANFDAELAKKLARQHAVDQIWPLMGYQLREQLHQIALAEEAVRQRLAPVSPISAASTLQPHQQRVVEEKRDLDEKVGKLTDFINQNPAFRTLSDTEQDRLKEQAAVMATYSDILGDRIAAFAPAA